MSVYSLIGNLHG